MKFELTAASGENISMNVFGPESKNGKDTFSISTDEKETLCEFVIEEDDSSHKRAVTLVSQTDAFEPFANDFNLRKDYLLKQISDVLTNGTDLSDQQDDSTQPYDPSSIKVRTDKLPITLIRDMIDGGDMDISPAFQRNFVWDAKRKSLLIESILLRIPLPMFYFSEDEDGKMSIIDGLQRTNTIYDFMCNKFALKDLQYLDDCNGCYYSKPNAKGQKLNSRYFRYFNLTTISANIIDAASPTAVKYDIFRRINTGGMPLYSQEIRNCLAAPKVRGLLTELAGMDAFKTATDGGIWPVRMIDQEVVLRYLMFRTYYERSGNIDEYNDNMETSLDSFMDKLKDYDAAQYDHLKQGFVWAMQNAEYLIGPRYTFRKITPADLKEGARKQLINKALFVNTAILLADYDPAIVKEHNQQGALTNTLAEEIKNNQTFRDLISYGTNGKKNMRESLAILKDIFARNIKTA